MKLVLKTLKQVPHEVEVESDETTIKTLKELTELKHGITADTIKLVFNGIVLKDENSIKSYNITEGNVLVMMVSKTKVQNKPKVEEVPVEKPKEVPSSTSNTGNTQSNINNNVGSNPSTSVNQGGEGQGTQNTGSGQTAPNYTNEVNTLVDMGFPKDYSETAIKAAQGNVNLAIEFLYNGIPENLPSNNNTTTTSNNTVPSTSNTGGSSSTSQTGGQQPMSSLDAVKRLASIVKVLCANDPSQLQHIIMGLQQTRPELIELIKEHETEFKQIIQSPVTDEDLSTFSQFNNELGIGSRTGGGSGSGTQGGQGGQGGGRQDVIRLSKPEFDVIQKLKEYGFSEMDAAQAYFACDKNEEMALNFLFEMKTQEGGSFENLGTGNVGNTESTGNTGGVPNTISTDNNNSGNTGNTGENPQVQSSQNNEQNKEEGNQPNQENQEGNDSNPSQSNNNEEGEKK